MRRTLRFFAVPACALLAAALLLTGPARSVFAHGPLHDQIAALDRAIEANPSDPQLLIERGELYRLDENPAAAARDFDRAEALDPGFPRVDLCRAALFFESGQAESALPRLDRYLAREPEDGEALRLRSRVLLSLGRPQDALADFDRALTLLKRVTPDDCHERARLQKFAGIDPGVVERELRASVERLRRPEVAAAAVTGGAGGMARSGSAAAPTSAATLAPLSPAATTLVARTATWKYLATAVDQGTAWRAAAYPDASWPSGTAVLGYGDAFITTTIPYGSDANNKWRTAYFRIHFNLADNPATIQSLTLGANYDDGFVAYLNGQEIVRRSLSGGTIVYSTFATNHEGGTWESIDVSSTGIPNLVPGDNVLAVEVHQTSASSSDLAIGMDLVESTGAPVLTRGPYLQIGTPTSLVIRWRTGAATDSRIRFGPSPANLSTTVDDTALTTEHEMLLSGLAPDTRYFYSVGSSTTVLAGGDSTFTFVTSPTPGTQKPTRIWVLGDSGDPSAFSIPVRNAFDAYTGARGTDLWLMLGDNAYNAGTDAEYQAGVFDVYPKFLKSSVLWPTRGNHDALYAGTNNDYYDIFSLPVNGEAGGVPSSNEAYYSFDYGNIHFICLDSEGSDRSPAGAMLDWLSQDLAADNQDWTIAFWHHPPYTKGSHDSDNVTDSGGRMRDMRENALPILEGAGVDLVLTGHSHSYERSYLLDEHYGISTTLVDSMKLDLGDGNPFNDGAYMKPGAGLHSHAGAVYAVAGSSCKLGGGALNHPAMVRSLNVLGSVVLDVNALQLDAVFLNETGVIYDRFTIVKSGVSGASDRPAPPIAGRPVNSPNPFQHRTRIAYTLGRTGPVSLTIHDVAGRLVASLVHASQDAGPHDVIWDGTDDGGRQVAPGVYFSVLKAGGTQESRKLVLTR